jgi:hypothetical protein
LITRTIVLTLAFALPLGCKKNTPEPPKNVEPPPKEVKQPEPPKTGEPPKAPPAASGSPVEVAGFFGLKVPSGGTSSAPPHGGTSMVIYRYMTSRETLATQLKQTLDAEKWKVDEEAKSPRGSVRMKVSKGGNSLRLSIAGVGTQAALIIAK